MIRKIALLFIVLFAASCTSKKVVIQTTRPKNYKPPTKVEAIKPMKLPTLWRIQQILLKR